jgi:hypothetical protein
MGGGPALARGIPKELTVSVLTVFGALSTVGIGLLLRRTPLGESIVVDHAAFVVFNIYGLAFSLISSAGTVIRRRDTVILILAATIMWGIFLAQHLALEMIRFLIFASLITVGVLAGKAIAAGRSGAVRIAVSAVLSGVLCGIGGLLYHGLSLLPGPAPSGSAAGPVASVCWGLSLGVAVGLGVSIGNEVAGWVVSKEGS